MINPFLVYDQAIAYILRRNVGWEKAPLHPSLCVAMSNITWCPRNGRWKPLPDCQGVVTWCEISLTSNADMFGEIKKPICDPPLLLWDTREMHVSVCVEHGENWRKTMQNYQHISANLFECQFLPCDSAWTYWSECNMFKQMTVEHYIRLRLGWRQPQARLAWH
jgi:hypothetical protein